MVRKQYLHSRRRSKRTRPKTPAPKNGWLIAELERISGASIRTLRYYVEQGLIRPLERRGTATRYARRELLRLLMILALRKETPLRLAQIKLKLDSLGDSELEAQLLMRPMSAAAATALGIVNVNVNVNANANAGAIGSIAVGAIGERNRVDAGDLQGRRGVETWHHIQLLPGLGLVVHSKASPAVREAAKRIHAEFVG